MTKQFKRLKHRIGRTLAFLALLSPAGAAQTAAAQDMIGELVQPEEFTDGMEVVFEARTEASSKGHYMFDGIHTPNNPDKYNWAMTVSDVLDIPEDIEFILVKANVQNAVTGLDQWYIKSKRTGKYLKFDWNWTGKDSGSTDDHDAWIELGPSGSYWAEDTASAKAFCIVSNGDAKWADMYGSKKYGNTNADWDISTYTVVHIFDNSDGHYTNKADYSAYWGRVYLASQTPNRNYNIRFFAQYQDNTPWDIRHVINRGEDHVAALRGAIDQYPSDVESYYTEGTDPGFVNNHEAYEEFVSAYNEAYDNLDSYTDAEAEAALNRLTKARAAVDSAIVKIEDGYYYIKTADEAFTILDNGEFAWTAPYNSTSAGWRAFKEDDNQFIWQVSQFPTPPSDTTKASTAKTGNMYYTFKNVGSEMYLGNASSQRSGEPALVTNDSSVRISAVSLGYGQWNIGSKQNMHELAGGTFPYAMKNHQDGKGTEGELVLSLGDKGSPSAWYIRKVPAEQIAGIDDPARKAKEELLKTITKYDGLTDGVEVGPEIGKPHSQAVVDNVSEAMRVAKAFLSGETVGTKAQIDEAAEALASAAENFKNEVNSVPDGYYRIRSNYPKFHANDNDAYFALYNDSTPGWKHYEKTTEQLWKIAKVENGFSIQNVKNGMYLNKAARSANFSLVDMTPQFETAQQITPIVPNGKLGIYNVVDSTFGYDPANHGSGAGEVGRLELYSPLDANGGTSWSLIPVSDEDAQALIANEPDNELNLNLQAKFEEGRALYNSNTDYTIGDAIVTNATAQVFSNNPSDTEGFNYEHLIDGDKNTFWNSAWEDNGEKDPSNPHYLRIYDEAGFPDTVQVNYVTRQNATWRRVAVKMRVQVSNDAENWTSLYELKPADVANNGKVDLSAWHTDSLHYIVSGLKGYKYVRFITEVNRHSNGSTYLNGNNHMLIEYAEYNLYPVTGVSSSSQTQKPSSKSIAAELWNALQEAYPQYINGNATQATYDRLAAAVETFKGISRNDSILNMAQYNAANLTAGNRIGEFPAEALEAYKQVVNAQATPLIESQSEAAPSTAEVKEAIGKLTEAYHTLYKTMVKPEKDVWYMILSGNGEEGKAIAAGGPSTHRTKEDGYSYFLYNYLNEADASDETGLSFTVNEDADGRYVLQVVSNGGYFGPLTGTGDSKYDYHPIIWYAPKSFEIVPFGDGQIGFVTADGYYVRQNGGSVMDYTKDMNNYGGFLDSGYAWTLKRTDEDHSDLAYMIYGGVAQHRVLAITVPYEIKNPSKCGNEDIYAYELAGKTTTDEGDSIVTAYWLKKIDGETVGAGVPAVYIAPGEVYDESQKADIVFTPVLNTALQAEVDTVNGLRSTNCYWVITEPHMGYFLEDSVVDKDVSGRQRAYIIPRLVKNLISSVDEADAVVYVKGAGQYVGINKDSKIVAVRRFVDVYSIDGTLLRKHIDATTATNGLKNGIYIVGNKKVYVR